jgi:hypothetical protein
MAGRLPVLETRITRAVGVQTSNGLEGRFGSFVVDLLPAEGTLHVDVYHPGAYGEESVASLRIDTDEGTVTLYDPASDEASTVFEAEPERPPVCGHRGCTLRPGHIPGHTDR